MRGITYLEVISYFAFTENYAQAYCDRIVGIWGARLIFTGIPLLSEEL